MQRTVFKIFLFSYLLLQATSSDAQSLTQWQQAFNNYQQNVLNEKLFVHTDKESYLAGEPIWFKLYNVDADFRTPLDISKIAYVEVLDQQNNPILQTKVDLKNGIGSGSFDLPLTPSSGKYKFRAYTKLMQNFGPDFFFEKPIAIFNPQSAPEQVRATANLVDLQFFPEGGNLVYGFASKVGVRAINNSGKGIFVRGAIVDNLNDTVAKFQTLRFGNGQFKFTPIAGRVYKAIALTNNKEVVIKELGNIFKQGYVMGLDREAGKINIKFQSNLPGSVCYLFVHQGKQISLALQAPIQQEIASFSFEEAKLPEGVSYVTIFSADGKPVCERLYFKPPTKQLQIIAGANLPQYSLRQKVTVNVESKTDTYQPTAANLSVAVRRIDSLQLQDQSDISSYLWLSSVLKGNFESPSFYLNNQTADGVLALENLLLTQGWRKFDWDGVLQPNKPSLKFLPEYNGHLINGLLTQANGTPKINTLVYMGVPGKRTQFFVSQTDSTGKFLFNTKDLYGRNEIVMQTNYREDSTSSITVQSPYSEKYTTTTYPSLSLMPSVVKELERHYLASQVTQRFADQPLKQFFLPEIDTTDFFQTPFKSYVLKEYTVFNTLEEVIREYVREALISKRENKFHITVVGETKWLANDPLVLIDGVPRFDFDRLLPINPNVIEKIDIVRNRYFYGPMITDGILKVTTYKNNLQAVAIDPNAVVIDYEGVQLKRTFYAPRYESQEEKNSRVPDFRNVLYWLPNLVTDEKGKSSFDFYTSDQPGTYIGIVQGITAQGLPGSRTFTFEVKK